MLKSNNIKDDLKDQLNYFLSCIYLQTVSQKALPITSNRLNKYSLFSKNKYLNILQTPKISFLNPF